jgi:hypothetical protein
MEDHEKITKQIKQTFLELEKHSTVANEKLRVFLKDLPPTEMIDRINQLNLSDKSLNFLCEGIALEAEDYEICMAVAQIKKDRAKTPTQVKEDIPVLPEPPVVQQ